jgi:hypothetical protein
LIDVLAELLGTLLVVGVMALTKSQLLNIYFLNFIFITITHWLHWAYAKASEITVYRLDEATESLRIIKSTELAFFSSSNGPVIF